MESQNAIQQMIYGITAVALIFGLYSVGKSKLPRRLYDSVMLIAGVFALILVWYIAFWYIAVRTEAMLAPWDQWGNLRPPTGTWQRELNDFFDREPNYYLPGIAIIAVNLVLLLKGMARSVTGEIRYHLPLAFALTNLAFLVSSFLSIFILYPLPDLWLPQPRPTIDVGYHRTWPALLVTGALLVGLFWWEWRLGSPSRPHGRE